MGHAIFLGLHFLAIVLGFVFLFVTIPLHLIYTAIRSNRSLPPRDTRSLSRIERDNWREFFMGDDRCDT